jgi:hypothetical protein
MERIINNGENKIDTKEILEAIMIESLIRVEKISITITALSMASLCGMLRRK